SGGSQFRNTFHSAKLFQLRRALSRRFLGALRVLRCFVARRLLLVVYLLIFQFRGLLFFPLGRGRVLSAICLIMCLRGCRFDRGLRPWNRFMSRLPLLFVVGLDTLLLRPSLRLPCGLLGTLQGRGQQAHHAQAGGAPAYVTSVARLLEIGSQVFVGDGALVFQILQRRRRLGLQFFERRKHFIEQLLHDGGVHRLPPHPFEPWMQESSEGAGRNGQFLKAESSIEENPEEGLRVQRLADGSVIVPKVESFEALFRSDHALDFEVCLWGCRRLRCASHRAGFAREWSS